MTEQPAQESSLERMIAIFDVTPAGPGPSGATQFTGESDGGGGRNVVDGSQMLAQSIVAAGKAFPGRTVRTAHSLFVSAASPGTILEFTVEPVRAGRSFASTVVTASQGGRTCVATTVLLDYPQPDVIRHDHPAGSPEAGPEESYPSPMPLAGRELRIAGVRERDSADEVGPPVMDAWLRYATVPSRDAVRRALLAHFTGHLGISTTFRAHAGIGTAQAHYTVSTAPMGIGISFHEPVDWDGWIRYHHESTYVGAGMSYVRGQILTADGRLMASFTQDAMIRGFDDNGTPSAIPAEARLLPDLLDAMDWPIRFPGEMTAGTISVRPYDRADAAELFAALDDERAWEHIPRAIPADAAEVDEGMRSSPVGAYRAAFTVRQDARVVGTTSVFYDADDPEGVEVGATQFHPGVWGTGVNTEVKRLLFEVIFQNGAQWIQLRTDERNGRSAAAIRKLGATDLGVRQDRLVRRDGTRRRSRFFRLGRPAS